MTAKGTKPLAQVLEDVDILASAGGLEVNITGITNDSRAVKEGDCFVAVRGFREDGLTYVADAVKRGAAAVVSEAPPDDITAAVVRVQVPNDRQALSRMAAAFYDRVTEKYYSIGITGTNGKTTTTALIASILEKMGKTARIGTLGMACGDVYRRTALTTPEAPELFGFLEEAHKMGAENLVMEVSSVALELHRVDDFDFSQGVFTNFTGDHLDFHKTMEDYLEAKLALFRNLGSDRWAVINIDDPVAERIIRELVCRYITYGFSEDADVRPLSFTCTLQGIRARLKTPRGDMDIKSSLVGRINLLNIMAAVASALARGMAPDAITQAVAAIPPLKGRLDFVYRGEFSVLIDYAHTDKALEAMLESLREVTEGRVIVVFGAGGSRDKSKRPRMGEAAAKFAHRLVVTSDNPRQEDPDAIIKDILSGLPKDFTGYVTEPDREAAIAKALDMAQPGDLVAVAGKGHEDYQIFKDKTIHFDDYEVVRNHLRKGGKHA